jgi:aspartate ammonia-lyase
MEKMAGDLRILASDVHRLRSLSIPARQAGSSVMPGKVNPVIAEFVISSSHKVYSNDLLISGLAAQGSLELNAYLPLIGHGLLESIKSLIAADRSMARNMLAGIEIEAGEAEKQVMSSPVITTALLPYIGYKKAAVVAGLMKEEGLNIFEANEKLGYIRSDKLIEILKPENLVQGGYRMKDLEE